MALENNSKITVTIAKGAVTASDSTTNDAKITRTFITTTSPIYASVDYIVLGGGEILEGIPEAAIYAASFAASTLVDDILLFDVSAQFPDTTTRAYKFFNRARTEFVRCKATADLLRAVIAGKSTSAGRKLLADFSVDNSNLAGLMTQARPILKDFIECFQYWQKVLFAGGATDFEAPLPKAGVRGGYIPDGFGGIGRGWIADSDQLKYREPETRSGNTMSRPRRFGIRNPLSDWHES